MSLPALHASARFGLGPEPNEMAAIQSNPRDWLIQQINNAAVPPELRGLTSDNSVNELYQLFFAAKRDKKNSPMDDDKFKELRKSIQESYRDQTGRRLLVQVQSKQPFIERLNLFWSNHFTVSVKKPIIAGMVNQYEVEAIRPHITGKFVDMLLAVEQHPAMLIYLDNVTSVGPNSRRGIRANKNINENLGREILELHTLGVDSGYTQDDVIALAKIITGWTLDHEGTTILPQFSFQPNVHEPGPKTLLGKTYPESGHDEGVQALTDIARHPATAKHIATKLARHFISDDPPQTAVDQLTQVFLQTDGDLAAVYTALINMDTPWMNPLGKFKTGYEFLVSALRLRDIEPEPQKIMGTFRAINVVPFSAPSPAGLPDTAEYWAGSDAIMKRIDWARIVAQKIPVQTNSLEMANYMFSSMLHADSTKIIAGAASPRDAFAFLLASPEFQRR
jgi:uncharacterized protein (DUF1800 family)